MTQTSTSTLRAFHITVGHRDHPRLSFPAMAPDAMTARDQHDCLRQEGERLEVTPAQRMRAELQELADELGARRQDTQLRRRAMAIEPVTLPARAQGSEGSYGRWQRTCSLCGDKSAGEVCGRCSAGLERHGL